MARGAVHVSTCGHIHARMRHCVIIGKEQRERMLGAYGVDPHEPGAFLNPQSRCVSNPLSLVHDTKYSELRDLWGRAHLRERHLKIT